MRRVLEAARQAARLALIGGVERDRHKPRSAGVAGVQACSLLLHAAARVPDHDRRKRRAVAGPDPITLSIPPAGPLLPPTALEGAAGVDFSATVFLAWMDPAGLQTFPVVFRGSDHRLGAVPTQLDRRVGEQGSTVAK